MPQILFQDVHHAKNKSLLIMEQFAIYLDLASNVRREREQECGGGLFRGCSDEETGREASNKYLRVFWKIKFYILFAVLPKGESPERVKMTKSLK